MNKKLNVLHVIPTLKKDGAEFQLSELFKQFSDINVEVFTFDLYEEGDSIINNPVSKYSRQRDGTNRQIHDTPFAVSNINLLNCRFI